MSESRGNNITGAQNRTVPEHHSLGVVDDVVGDLPGKFPDVASFSVSVSTQKPSTASDTFSAAVGPLDDVRICPLLRKSRPWIVQVQNVMTSIMVGRLRIAPQTY